MKSQLLSGKVLWVTGSSSGIGAALAEEASRRGARLVLSGRNEEALGRVAARCAAADVAILPFDLAEPRKRAEAARRAATFFGPVDFLLLNAGVSQRSPFIGTSPEVFDLIMETNFRASVDIVRILLPEMLDRGSGGIVCVSSIAGLMGAPWRTAYSASKHALGGFFSSLRAELSGGNISVTVAFPGFVRTAISENALEGNGSRHGALDPLQEFGQDPRKTAGIILNGIEAGRAEIRVAFDAKARLGLFLSRRFPAFFATSIARHGGL